MIRAEIWVEFVDELETVAEVDSKYIEVDTYEEIDSELEKLVEKTERKFTVTDSGYEVINIDFAK